MRAPLSRTGLAIMLALLSIALAIPVWRNFWPNSLPHALKSLSLSPSEALASWRPDAGGHGIASMLHRGGAAGASGASRHHQELSSIARTLYRELDEMVHRASARSDELAVTKGEDGSLSLTLRASGMAPDTIAITVDNDVLRIAGKSANGHIRHSLTLPSRVVVPGALRAEEHAGTLRVTIPAAALEPSAASAPKQIPITHVSSSVEAVAA